MTTPSAANLKAKIALFESNNKTDEVCRMSIQYVASRRMKPSSRQQGLGKPVCLEEDETTVTNTSFMEDSISTASSFWEQDASLVESVVAGAVPTTVATIDESCPVETPGRLSPVEEEVEFVLRRPKVERQVSIDDQDNDDDDDDKEEAFAKGVLLPSFSDQMQALAKMRQPRPQIRLCTSAASLQDRRKAFE